MYTGRSFFLAPAGPTKLSDYIDVEIKFRSEDVEPDTIPSLIYWDNGTFCSMASYTNGKGDGSECNRNPLTPQDKCLYEM